MSLGLRALRELILLDPGAAHLDCLDLIGRQLLTVIEDRACARAVSVLNDYRFIIKLVGDVRSAGRKNALLRRDTLLR
jgi:hypothetical protein